MYTIVGRNDGEITSLKGETSTISVGDTVMYKGDLELCTDVEKYLMGKVIAIFLDTSIAVDVHYCAVVEGTGSCNKGDIEVIMSHNISDLWVIRNKDKYGFRICYI